MRPPTTKKPWPFMAPQPATSDRDQKIAHLALHGARFYLFQGNDFGPRIIVPPVEAPAPILRGSTMQNGPWDMTPLGTHTPGAYHEAPWSKLQPEQLDSLEWSFIEQFLSLHRNSTR